MNPTATRHASPTIAAARRLAMVALAAVGGGLALAAIPSLAFQIALVLVAATALVTVITVRLGLILNAAFVVMAVIYLVGPIGSLLTGVGIGLSTIALVVLAPAPFVVAALYLRHESRERLVYLAPFAGLIALASVSLAWSPSPVYGLEKLVLWVVTGFLPAASIIVLASASSRPLWGAIVVAAFLSAVILLGFGEATALYPGQVTTFGDNPIWTGRAAFFGATVLIFGPFPRTVKVTVAPVLILAGLLAGSLGPVLAFAAALWFGIAEMLRSAVRKTDRLGLGWLALGLASGFALVVLLADAFFGGNASILARIFVNDPNVSGRTTFLDAALRLFASSPFLGVGIGGFLSTGLIQYPHNLVAEIGSELGGIGLVLLAIWFSLALRGSARSPLLLALLVATSLYAMFSGSVGSNAEFWMVSALCVANIAVRSRAAPPAHEANPVATGPRPVALAAERPAPRS